MARTKVRFYNRNDPRFGVIPAVIHESNCNSSGNSYPQIWDLPIGVTYEFANGWWEQFPSEFAAQVAALLQASRRGASPLSITWEADCSGCYR